ncbi:MAG: hypothetical protein ACOVT5_11020, partial [Armatimonadaceae bacterium]
TSGYAGANVSVRVELLAAAPPGGVVLDLVSSQPGVIAAPATVTIAAGATSGSFNTVLGAVNDDTAVQVRASFAGTTVSGGIVVRRPAPKSLTVAPATVFGGETATATVSLMGKAPTGGVVVALESMDQTVLTVPAQVTIAAGATSANFTVTSAVVDSNQSVLLTATVGPAAATASVTVRRNGPVSLSIAPNSIIGGASANGKLTLQRPAPSGGLSVALTSTSPEAQVPSTVLVPAGSRVASFAITTSAVTADLVAGIRAERAGLVVSATVAIAAPVLSAVNVVPNRVTGGLGATGTVTLTGPAPASGLVVELATSGPAASVPATVVVPAGALTVPFAIATTPVAADTTVTIVAVQNLETKTAVLTVRK